MLFSGELSMTSVAPLLLLPLPVLEVAEVPGLPAALVLELLEESRPRARPP
jgi:hypothetical protein